MKFSGLLRASLLATVLSGALAGCGFGERDDVLILAGRGDLLSRSIAETFAAARDIPDDRILELSVAPGARDGTIDAETYHRDIAGPIERHLALHDRGNDVALLVTTRGLPLLVKSCSENTRPRCQRVALDSALAQLGRTTPEDAVATVVANPYFRQPGSFEDFRSDQPEAALRFLVARLTAPSTEADDPIRIPRALARAIDPDRADPSEEADAPIVWRIETVPGDTRTHAARYLLGPIEPQMERRGHVVCAPCTGSAREHPVSGVIVPAATTVIARAGARPVRLRGPGLIVSLGVTTSDPRRKSLPTSFEQTVARWLGRGARALSLHLTDAGLPTVSRPETQLVALASGASAIEAHWKSVPVLGGGNVFVGDPLAGLDGEIAAATDDQDGDGIADRNDNCPFDANPDQRDSNDDGFGNRCDADVDDDGLVDTSGGVLYPLDTRGDLEHITLTARNGPHDPDHDLDGDGRVDDRDLILARLALHRPPGR